MTYQNLPDSTKVMQVFPEKKQCSLAGLYLDQKLAEMSTKMGRSLVITNFLTDKKGVIANADEHHHFQVPMELKNPSDWQLFQELMAQADVIISGGAHLRRVSALGNQAEDIFYQFEPGRRFEKLGEWRLRVGYKTRSPDLAIVTRSLDFKIPDGVLKSGRKTMIFTTDTIANSANVKAFTTSGTDVIGSGEAGVDGNRMIETLSHEMGYHVILMATGPAVLEILLVAKRMDIFYITEVQKEIPSDDSSNVMTILRGGKKVDELDAFHVSHQYLQGNVITEDGTSTSQLFLRYDKNGLLDNRSLDES